MKEIYQAIQSDNSDNSDRNLETLDFIGDLFRELSDLGQGVTMSYTPGKELVINRLNVRIGYSRPIYFAQLADPTHSGDRSDALANIVRWLIAYIDGAKAQADYEADKAEAYAVLRSKSKNPEGWQSVDGVQLPAIDWTDSK